MSLVLWQKMTTTTEEYPLHEPELSYFLVSQAPYKYYKILMSGAIGKEKCMEIRAQIIFNLRWRGPFGRKNIRERLAKLMCPESLLTKEHDYYIFLAEVPYHMLIGEMMHLTQTAWEIGLWWIPQAYGDINVE